jgi:hypothetical protein
MRKESQVRQNDVQGQAGVAFAEKKTVPFGPQWTARVEPHTLAIIKDRQNIGTGKGPADVAAAGCGNRFEDLAPYPPRFS